MGDETIYIAELRLRVPGLSADEARTLGEDVVRRVREHLSPDVSRQRLGALAIRLTASAEADRGALVEEVATRIVSALQ